MSDANQQLFDEIVRHAVDIERFSRGEVRQILKILNQSDRELVAKIRKRLAGLKGPIPVRTKEMIGLLREVRVERAAAMAKIKKKVTADIVELAQLEKEFQIALMQKALPIIVEFQRVHRAAIRAAVTQNLFSGGVGSARNLSQWFASLRRADQFRIQEVIQLGLSQGEGVEQMVARLRRVLDLSHHNAEAVIRTAVSHATNSARDAVWDANADIVEALRWTSTLDGRTTAICRSRDGKFGAPGSRDVPDHLPRLDPPTARPPAHPSCRSILVAVFSVDGVARVGGNRPFVRDTRTGKKRQKDFRSEARALAGSKWKTMSAAQRNAAVRRHRNKWYASNVGTVPSETTYQQWLSRQPAAFQDDVLGVTKGRLFRRGELQLEKFIDRTGAELTLPQLAKKYPAAFVEAGLDPKDFL